jgi:hypothetical protein
MTEGICLFAAQPKFGLRELCRSHRLAELPRRDAVQKDFGWIEWKRPEDFFSPTFGPLPPYSAGIEVFQRDTPNRNHVWRLKSEAICPDKAIADLQHT